MPAPPGHTTGARGAMGCAALDDGPVGIATGNGPYIYCAGGLMQGMAIEHVQVYEIGTDTWYDVADMPAGPRDRVP